MKIIVSLVLLIVSPLTDCAQQLIDPEATPETKALFKNLLVSASRGVMLGHHEDDAYGVGWWATEGRSDIKDLVGSYPAVHGWDLGKIELQWKTNIDSVSFEKMHQWIDAVYRRGGVNTISWHIDNPVSKKNAWDKTRAVSDILPGGASHAYFVQQLDYAAEFLLSCKSGSTPIPFIFRPWHEHNGDWFWWGKGNCSEEDFVRLWKFTVTYLRDTKNIHQLIYAFSPDRSRMSLKDPEASYQYGYPGDGYVDVLGIDDYQDVGVSKSDEELQRKNGDFSIALNTISQLGKTKRKLAAVTETGQESVINPKWFSSVLLQPFKADKGLRISYVMLWRNANRKHHYAPYPGHPAAPDFKQFAADPWTLFESDLVGMYR